jgi:predicted dehydrogenase
MVRAIQVGVGWWGIRWTREFIPAVPDVEMVGYVARSTKSREALAAAGIDQRLVFTSLAEAVEWTAADLLINATRTGDHLDVITEALSLGLHVLTDKPLANTVAEGRLLVARAAEARRILAVADNYRYTAAPIEAAKLMRAAKFGDPTMVKVNFRQHVKTMGFDHPYPEIADPILSDMGIHLFDLMRMVLGDEPRRVSCRSWNLPTSGFAGKPIALATIEFMKGTIALFDASFLSSGKPTAWGGEWTLDCADGEIWWTSREGADRVVLTPIGQASYDVPLSTPRYADSAGALHAMTQTDEAPTDLITGAEYLKSTALSEAAIISASRDGHWIEIETFH